MNSILAQTISGTIANENQDFYFVQAAGQTFALAKSEGEQSMGAQVAGFIYRDMYDKLRLTTVAQMATQETFGWGTVTDVRRDLGVFVATGLPDKDVVVSLDDLPEDKAEWPKKGDQLYIKLLLDKKNRLWGHLAWAEDFRRIADPAFDNMQNQNLRAIVYRNRETGTFVYLPDNNMLGFIHPSERQGTLRIGQELTARVVGFRQEDRTLYLSAKPRAYETLDADGQMILAYLEMQDGRMPLNDKSTPEDILATFGLSKGQFKKALGGLMKQQKIRQTVSGTERI